MNTREKLKTAFVQALAIPPDTPEDTLAYRQIPQWDSMAHMILVQEIEAAFGIMLSTDEVIDLSSFEKGMEIVAKHGVDASA